jgi:hypothetical protein
LVYKQFPRKNSALAATTPSRKLFASTDVDESSRLPTG